MVWRVTGEARVERGQANEFMHGVIDRVRAEDAMEVAQADAVREASKMIESADTGAQTILESRIKEHTAAGYHDTEEALARVMMEECGLDPNNPKHVMSWNQKQTARQH